MVRTVVGWAMVVGVVVGSDSFDVAIAVARTVAGIIAVRAAAGIIAVIILAWAWPINAFQLELLLVAEPVRGTAEDQEPAQ